MKLPLVYYGDPFLRRKATPVGEVTEEIRTLVDEMLTTLREKNGCGLAAPQVRQDLRLFIVCLDKEDSEGKLVPGELLVFIDPVLSEPGKELHSHEEGCLSIPGVYGEVVRPKEVTIEATDLNGVRFKKRAHGLEARVIMHENDHLNGVLIIDRFDKNYRRHIEPKLREIKKKHK